MSRTYCVYKHTNRINGKVYIGITSQKPRDRWDSGWGYQQNKHFWDSIQKYGWNNFDHEILFSNLSQSEAFVKEKELILYYDSQNYKKGYNNSPGGESGPGLRGEKHPMFGKHHTPEAKARMSARKTGVPYSPERYARFLASMNREEMRGRAYRTIVGYNKGKSPSEETRKKIADSNRGLKRSEETKRRVGEAHKIPILQFTISGEFVREWDCGKSAAYELSIQAGHISKVCRGQRKTAGGFVWRYLE